MVFDMSDGVRLHAPGAGFAPLVTKSADGRVWFVPFDGVSVFDPVHLPFIEQITADGKRYDAASGLRLPPLVRDLTIDYTALSLAVPEKVRFRFKLEGQDKEWREVVNEKLTPQSAGRNRSKRVRNHHENAFRQFRTGYAKRSRAKASQS